MLTTLAAQVAIAIENARLYQAVRRQERQLENATSPWPARCSSACCRPTRPPHPTPRWPSAFCPPAPSAATFTTSSTTAPTAPPSSSATSAARPRPPPSSPPWSAASCAPPPPHSLSPPQMLALLNDALQERKLDSQYVTMLFALWNDENQTLQVANSGAVQPVFCRAGQSITVQAEGFPLGLFPNVTYDEINVATQPGDVIVFVSDGILDAENEKDEMYGEERLSGLLCAHRDHPAQDIADAILADVTRFQGAHDRFDDETIIVLRVR